MNPVEEQEVKQNHNQKMELVQAAPVLPIVLDLDEETIQILLDDQIATGG